MCLTIPAQIIRIEGKKAIVWQYDRTMEVDISMLPDVSSGDWILYISSFAIKKIEKKDADEIMELLVSKPPLEIENLDKRFVEIIKNSRIRGLNKEEIVYLLKSEGLEQEALFREAEITRKTYIRDFICVHGIIEFSNFCSNNCMYCGLRKDNNEIGRYRLEPDSIVKLSVEAVNNKGYKLLVLQSGEDLYYTKEMLVDIIKKIKSKCRVFIFISIGDRDYETYKSLKIAGASGALYRFETSNPDLFKKVHNVENKIPLTHPSPLRGEDKGEGIYNKNYSTRFEHLKFMKEMGYFIASGSLIGLPGQSFEDLAEDLLTLQKLNINMISMGPFLPCPGTPLSSEPSGDINVSLKMISVARLMMKRARIPVVTALETLDPVNGRKLAMRAGANALMFNLTPEEYNEDYKIYPNRVIEKNSMFEKYALFNKDGSYEMLEQRLIGELTDNEH